MTYEPYGGIELLEQENENPSKEDCILSNFYEVNQISCVREGREKHWKNTEIAWVNSRAMQEYWPVMITIGTAKHFIQGWQALLNQQILSLIIYWVSHFWDSGGNSAS